MWVSPLPPSLLVQTLGPRGQPGLGVPPGPAKTMPQILRGNEMGNPGCEETLEGGFLFFFFFNFYCYSITVVCLFSPSLHPTSTLVLIKCHTRPQSGRGLQLCLDSAPWVGTAPWCLGENDKGLLRALHTNVCRLDGRRGCLTLLKSLSLISNCEPTVTLNHGAAQGEIPQLLSVSPGT